ncbi:MAG: conserved membrane protein of unknown function [Candidatus Thorarchaeota archaeon]|nr:MAG: conserved membrane protein of unknown function [Candidatus Thorarchaeota archaeon]
MQGLGIFDLTLDEIMLFFQDPWVVGWVLIASGIIAAAWLLENITDPIPLLGTIFDILIKVGTYVGFFVGILDMLVGYVVWATNPEGIIVAAVLVITGFSLVMRLLSKFPLALVFAVAVAAFGTFTLYGALAPYASDPFIGQYIEQVISLKWMAVIGVVIFCVVYVLGGLVIKLIQLIGKIFSATPVSVLIGLAAIAVGIIVIVAPGLVGLVIPWPAPTP